MSDSPTANTPMSKAQLECLLSAATSRHCVSYPLFRLDPYLDESSILVVPDPQDRAFMCVALAHLGASIDPDGARRTGLPKRCLALANRISIPNGLVIRNCAGLSECLVTSPQRTLQSLNRIFRRAAEIRDGGVAGQSHRRQA